MCTKNVLCTNCGSRCELCDEYNKAAKEWEKDLCVGCGKRQVIFSGHDTKDKFCRWLIHDQHRNTVAIIHNGRAYDVYFIYNYLMGIGISPDPVIFSGSKIMYMYIQKLNMKLLDSLNFLPMPLARLPKSFELKKLKKGFFPHFYNTIEHEHAMLPSLPDIKYYDPDSMSKERRKEFKEWYQVNKNKPFNFQKEMKEYCISDVDILQKACCRFRELMMEATGTKEYVEDIHNMILKTIYEQAIDPFLFLTIASVCMGIFRVKFLPETWQILTEHEAKLHPECKHEWNCKCTWLPGQKVNGFSEIEVLVNGI